MGKGVNGGIKGCITHCCELEMVSMESGCKGQQAHVHRLTHQML